ADGNLNLCFALANRFPQGISADRPVNFALAPWLYGEHEACRFERVVVLLLKMLEGKDVADCSTRSSHGVLSIAFGHLRMAVGAGLITDVEDSRASILEGSVESS